jgi:hypothetical protein
MTNEIKVKKLTKKDRFNQLLEIPAVQADTELVAFIEHEIELLSNKNKADNKKPTAKQLENEALKIELLNYMEVDTLYSISDFQKQVEACADLSNQKIAAVLRQMKDNDKTVEKVEDKRKVYWKLA